MALSQYSPRFSEQLCPTGIRLARTTVVVLALLASVLSDARAASGAVLYVYLPTSLGSRQLQLRLSESLQGVDVTVFGRFRDLDRAVQESPPDAVLSIQPVLEKLGLNPALRGFADGSSTENWVLLCPREKVSVEDAAKLRIAVVDILGRRGTSRWVGDLLSAQKRPRITRVAHMEDLLPLLSLDVADLLLVPERVSADLSKVSQLPLHGTHVRPVGRAQLGAIDRKNAELVARGLQKLDASLNGIMGVSKWQ